MSRRATMNLNQAPVTASGSTKRRKPTRTATASSGYSFAGFSMPTPSMPSTPAVVSRMLTIEERSVTIAVMGATGSGKTTFINQAGNYNLPVGHGLQSCTKNIQAAQPFKFNGCQVTLIDTPGFDDTTTTDTDVLKMIGEYLAKTYKGGKKLAGVVYLHRISDMRMGGTSRRNFKLFRELCGDSSLKNVVVGTTMWSYVDKETGEAREAELRNEEIFFKPVIDKGANFVRHQNTNESAQSIIRSLIDNQPMALQIQTEMVDQRKDISQTSAAAELLRDVWEQMERDKSEFAAFKDGIKEVVQSQDEETRQEIHDEQIKLHEAIIEEEERNQRLAAEYRTKTVELEQRTEEERREAEKESLKQKEEIGHLQEQLQQVTTTSDVEKDNLQKQLAHMNRQIQEKHPEPSSGRTGAGAGAGAGAGYFGVYGVAIDQFISNRSKGWW
ncbi:hypothetical protein VNI00_006199 [Paramarasmius palmivorus]|uniref:G domain-containing protein n=1 Tax=Paramarasmius palmivorus TaxID=297713 RepID=A0AAW0D5P5_9AGAR